MNLEVTSDTLKRPWCARLTGIEGFKQDEHHRMRFVRYFNSGCSVLPAGAPNTYHVSFDIEGIYELRSPGRLSDFYAYVDGNTKKLADPFPDNWADYMREHRVDYDGVWADIWDCLYRQYKRCSAVTKPPINPRTITHAELEEMIADGDL